MPRTVAVTGGQIFQDGTGLTVRVKQIDTNDRIHFSVVEDQEVTRSGEMSFSAFINRFTRIESVEDACVRIRRLGYVDGYGFVTGIDSPLCLHRPQAPHRVTLVRKISYEEAKSELGRSRSVLRAVTIPTYRGQH